jgi:hypothetical protein
MLAAVFEGNGKLILQDRPKPELEVDTEFLVINCPYKSKAIHSVSLVSATGARL